MWVYTKLSLFRKEVVKYQQDKLLGDVSISQPFSYTFLSLSFVVIVLCSFMYVLEADYHRKQRVQGYLLPTEGVIKLYAPGSAYVSSVFVEEGGNVDSNQPLFRLEYRHGTSSGVDLNRLLANEINNQLEIIETQKKKIISVYKSREEQLLQDIKDTGIQISLIELQKEQAEFRKQIAHQRLDRYESMRAKGFLSANEEENQKDLLITLKQEILTLDARRYQLAQSKRNQTLALERLPLERESELQMLHMTESSTRNRLIELEGESYEVVRSSKSGRVTALNIKEGQLLRPQQYMASILPKGATLYAELMVPTRAFGFIKEGQETRLRLEAFPHQKFGTMEAEIFETAENIMLPGEVPGPMQLTEPIYRVKAKLHSQTMQAYGKNLPLQAGMLLDADILIEKRSIAEWFFDPLISLKGDLEY